MRGECWGNMRKKVIAKAGEKTMGGENGGGSLVGKACGETVVAGTRGLTKSGREKKAPGRPRKHIAEDTKKSAIEAARIGIPMDKIAILCGFFGNDTGWARWLQQEPEFHAQLVQSRVAGEIAMQHTVLSGSDGWQGSAWTLERRHGCVARQQLEHSGPGGKSLTIAHQVLAVVNPAERA